MDISYLLFLQNIREATNNIFTSFFTFMTNFGSSTLILPTVCLIYWILDKKFGSYLMLSYGTGRLINDFLKVTACVYRPWIRDARVQPVASAKPGASGYSFPSGHTNNATVVYGGIASRNDLGKSLRFLMLLSVAFCAFSRNYLGVHTPQDVLVSLAVGAVVIFGMKKIMELLEGNRNRDVLILIGGVLFSVILIVYAAFKSYPMDYDAAGKLLVDSKQMAIDAYKSAGIGIGIYIGWFLERRLINYSTEGNTWQEKIRNFCLCYLGLLLFIHVLSPLIESGLGKSIGGVVGNMLQFFYIVFIAPAIMKALRK